MRAHGFRVSFTPLPEVLFTFPSRYSSTVGLPVVFSLAGWSPPIRAGFLVSCATQVAALPPVSVSPTGLSPSAAGVSTPFGYEPGGFLRPLLLPRRARRHAPGLGSSAFARRYSRNHCCFLLLRVLRCFSSPRWPHSTVVSSRTGSPIRTPADRPVFAGPRGFSQLVTSFIASGSLRHPPCALLRFPFVFTSPAHCAAGDTFRLCSTVCSYSFTCVCTMSMTFLFRGE